MPSTTRLAKPPSQTPLRRRNRASCTPATTPKNASPASRSHTAPTPKATAVVAICVAIATLIDVKNQEGVAMASARPARAASASASAAEASAAVGRWGVLSMLESIHASFPDRQV